MKSRNLNSTRRKHHQITHMKWRKKSKRHIAPKNTRNNISKSSIRIILSPFHRSNKRIRNLQNNTKTNKNIHNTRKTK
jgi:hypothetical protein